jgi:hypothetical protein
MDAICIGDHCLGRFRLNFIVRKFSFLNEVYSTIDSVQVVSFRTLYTLTVACLHKR